LNEYADFYTDRKLRTINTYELCYENIDFIGVDYNDPESLLIAKEHFNGAAKEWVESLYY